MRRPPDIEKQMDKCINIAHGVKGGDTLGEFIRATGESPCDHRESGVSRSIRRKAESWSEVSWEVGDAHSSEDEPSTKTVRSEGALACRGMAYDEKASSDCLEKGWIHSKQLGQDIVRHTYRKSKWSKENQPEFSAMSGMQ